MKFKYLKKCYEISCELSQIFRKCQLSLQLNFQLKICIPSIVADAKPDLIKQTQKVYLGTRYLDLHSVPAPVLGPFVTTQITQEEPIINSVDVGTRY